MKSVLDGLRVLVTRPQPGNDALAIAIRKAGGEPVTCPLFELRAVTDTVAREAALMLRDAHTLAVFVSPAAVRFACALTNGPLNAALAAVGPGTARELEARAARHVISPNTGAGSEALLTLPEFHELSDRRVLIVQGRDGRGLLQQTLRMRGAIVEELTCYERLSTNISPSDFMHLWHVPGIDAALLTSLGAWSALNALAGDQRTSIMDTDLVVVSDRIRDVIIASGWRGRVLVADAADNQSLVQAVMALGKSLRNTPGHR